MDTALLIIEYIGIVAFAVSGAMVAIDKEADYFGVVLLSLITCFAGGIMRDLLLGSVPPRFFTEFAPFILTCVISSVAVIIFATLFKRVFVEYETRINAVNNIVVVDQIHGTVISDQEHIDMTIRTAAGSSRGCNHNSLASD